MSPETPGASPVLCPNCGSPLPGGKWSHACPRCLIEAFGEEDRDKANDDVIPGYTILEEIARGGMGVVYRARQHQPNRVVALKMILPHLLDSPMIRARFQAEAESVAKLDHPNVLPIYEAGENRGTPYLTMKLVTGGSLSEHRARFLGKPEACAALVAAAARGVQHAHERGILHRDLKPANLLLHLPTAEATPVPMVSDFGLARILEAEPSGLTAPSAFLGTAGYLAPELIFGDSSAPTVQADLYSLGAILYELAAGQLPFGAETGLAALRRADRETPPSLRTLNPRLPKDLDAICLACLQREPSSRYRSAEALADDLDRFLEGSPVLAQKDTTSYRALKFARRNKAGLAVAALILLLLIGGIVTTSWQAHRAITEKALAERRFNQVRKLAHSVLFDYHDAIKSLPGATKVREQLVKDGLSYLDSLAAEANNDPALQRELAAAYERVGDVRGGQSNGSQDDIAGALESYAKALRIWETLVSRDPKDPQTRRGLARSHYKIGYRLYDTAQENEGIDHLQKAQALYLELTREQPGNDELQLELANSCIQLGRSLPDTDPTRMELYRTALAICERLIASNPADQRYRYGLWSGEAKLGFALWLQNDLAGAIAAGNKARALGEALLAEDPLNADYRRMLARTYQNGGTYRQESDKGAALDHYGKAATLDEELLVTDPGNALTRKDLALTHKKIADLLLETDDNSQTLLHYNKAATGFEEVVAGSPADLVSQFLVATCHAGAARMQARLGQIDVALEECRKANSILQKIPPPRPGYLGKAQASEYLGYAYEELAHSAKLSTSESRRHMSTARDMFRQTMDIIEEARSQSALAAHDNGNWATEIAAELAKCDKALKDKAKP